MKSYLRSVLGVLGKYPQVILLILLAVVILLLKPNIPFANDYHCDSWFQFGMYHFYDDYLRFYPNIRQISRLPAIFIGILSTELFSGILAEYVQFVFYFLISTISIYLTTRALFSAFSAVVITLFVATNSLFLGTLSVTYTAPSLAFLFLSTYFIVVAPLKSGRTKILYISLFGASAALTLHSHFIFAAFIFILPLYYLILVDFRIKNSDRWLGVVRVVIPSIIGAGAVTVVLGLINYLIFGGDIWFFLNKVNFLRSQEFGLSDSIVSLYWKEDWYYSGPIIGILLIGNLLAVFNLLGWWRRESRRNDESNRWRGAVVSCVFVIQSAANVIYNALGGITLQYDYYYVGVLPTFALLLAEIINKNKGQFSNSWKLYLILSALFILSIVPSYGILPYDKNGIPYLVFIAGAGLLVAEVGRYNMPSAARAWAIVLITSLLCFQVTVRPEQYGVDPWLGIREHDRKEAYIRIYQGMQFLDEFRFAQPPIFWTGQKDGLWELAAFPRSYLMCAHETMFPEIKDETIIILEPISFKPGKTIIIVANGRNLLDKAQKAVGKYGITLKELARKRISYRDKSYEMIVTNALNVDEPEYRP